MNYSLVSEQCKSLQNLQQQRFKKITMYKEDVHQNQYSKKMRTKHYVFAKNPIFVSYSMTTSKPVVI
jgi:hypothetical protein